MSKDVNMPRSESNQPGYYSSTSRVNYYDRPPGRSNSADQLDGWRDGKKSEQSNTSDVLNSQSSITSKNTDAERKIQEVSVQRNEGWQKRMDKEKPNAQNTNMNL